MCHAAFCLGYKSINSWLLYKVEVPKRFGLWPLKMLKKKYTFTPSSQVMEGYYAGLVPTCRSLIFYLFIHIFKRVRVRLKLCHV